MLLCYLNHDTVGVQRSSKHKLNFNLNFNERKPKIVLKYLSRTPDLSSKSFTWNEEKSGFNIFMPLKSRTKSQHLGTLYIKIEKKMLKMSSQQLNGTEH